MAILKGTRDRLQDSAYHLLDEYEAMLVFLASMNRSNKPFYDKKRETFHKATKAELKVIIQELEDGIQQLRRQFAATRAIGEYSKLLQSVNLRDDLTLTLPLHFLFSIFRNYENVAAEADLSTMPPHARIELDHRGKLPPQDRLQIHLLEAMLFEDMCYFYNRASELVQRIRPDPTSKRLIKEYATCQRAAVSSAFYMVEAYCNGLAFEALIRKGDLLKPKELQMVREWDDSKNNVRYLTIRDKLLHYPRILVGATAPLLQENNCSELDYLLTVAKQFRDAIVHANPSPDPMMMALSKARAFAEMSFDDCTKVVDNAIMVIERISTAIGASSPPFWLQRRSANGPFDDSVFD